MGLFDRKKKEPEWRGIQLNGGGRVEVVGESNYQEALEKVCGGKTESGVCQEVNAWLIPEPTNQWDPDAVRVALEIDGEFETVGYLARPAATAFKPVAAHLASKNLIGAAKAEIRGGWNRGKNKGNFGIELDLAQPDQCLPPEAR